MKTVKARYSITGQNEQVQVLRYENQLYLVRYSDNYEEWLPIAAFI